MVTHCPPCPPTWSRQYASCPLIAPPLRRCRNQIIHDKEADPEELKREEEEEQQLAQQAPSAIPPLLRSEFYINPGSVRIGQVIGHGSFGTVSRGSRIESSGRSVEVAIKRLSQAPGPKVQAQFAQEVSAMMSLRHPNIITGHGIFFDKTLSLVTDFMPLGPLDGYLQHNPGTPAKNLLLFVSQVAEGMEYISGRGMVHRDLAARNIMVASPTLCKISDFGMSRALKSSSEYYRGAQKGRWPLKVRIFGSGYRFLTAPLKHIHMDHDIHTSCHHLRWFAWHPRHSTLAVGRNGNCLTHFITSTPPHPTPAGVPALFSGS